MNETITFPAKRIMWGASRNGKSKLYEIDGKEVWLNITKSTFVPDENQGDPLYGNGDTKGKIIIDKRYWEWKQKLNEGL